MEIVADNYQIPLVLGRKGDVWSFGNDAKRLGVSREGYTVSNLFVKSLLREKVSLGEETYEAVWLLAKFIELKNLNRSNNLCLRFLVWVWTLGRF